MVETKKLKETIKKDEEFIPPDGGWGWIIIIAAGLANLCILPMFQQFGLLFRDKFTRLGFTSSQTTTIINVNSALTSCVGLANGPMFRKFSYRQVSLAGAMVIVISLVITTFCNSFITYLIFFSILYGIGYGISSSANALALNTYWKKRRRIAIGLSWTMTGLGPIMWPHIIMTLFAYYGESGSILILSGFAIHSVAFALLLHPVAWHGKTLNSSDAKKNLLKPSTNGILKKAKENGHVNNVTKIKNISVFSSQYLYNEDDPVTPGYEITDPGVPMMIRANDGYFSQSRQSRSKLSSGEESVKTSRLNSKKTSMANLAEGRSRKSSTLYLNDSIKNSSANLGAVAQDRDFKPKRKTSINLQTQIPESEIEDCPTLKAPQDLKVDEKVVVDTIDLEKAKSMGDKAEKNVVDSESLKSCRIDGQYGDKYNKNNHSNLSLRNPNDHDEKMYLKNNHSNLSSKTRNRKKSNNFNFENEVLKQASLKLEQYLKDNENDEVVKLKLLLNSNLDDNVFDEKIETIENVEEVEEELTFWQKVAIFFDLDLLKDFTFINLMLGMTLACFNELNFSLLTPFILGDYGMSKSDVALFLSVLAGVDISIRFCVPFIAGKVGWDNNSFFLFGVMIMTLGRVILAHFFEYHAVVILVAIIIGFGKGLRTVFMALVIPTYVPLNKLPGATGLQLITAGFVYFTLGPILGWIKDNASTAVTLYSLNIFTWLTALSWGLEKYMTSKRQDHDENISV